MYGYDVFHNEIMTELINTVRNNESRHAYLFSGPRGVGKKKAARLFCAALACQNSDIAPCGRCPACIGAKSETNPDIIYVKPKEKKSVSVEQAREIVADAYIKPFMSTKKIYIFEDASLLNDFTQNSLLKVLEEPPEYITFIILSDGEEQLLQTVLSRCTSINFPSISDEKMRDYIKTTYPEQFENAPLIISLSQGIAGEADKILSDPDYDIIRKESLKMLTPLLSRHKISAYTVCEFLENNKDKADLIISLWQSFLRDIMLIKNSSKHLVVNKDTINELEMISNNISDRAPIVALEKTIRANMMLKKYVNLHALGLNLAFGIKSQLYN